MTGAAGPDVRIGCGFAMDSYCVCFRAAEAAPTSSRSDLARRRTKTIVFETPGRGGPVPSGFRVPAEQALCLLVSVQVLGAGDARAWSSPYWAVVADIRPKKWKWANSPACGRRVRTC